MLCTLLKSGRFSVSIEAETSIFNESDSTTQVGDIGPGETVGEIGFLSGIPRTATVTAIRDSIVLRLERSDYESLCETVPGLLRDISVSLASKLAAVNRAVKKPVFDTPRTLLLCPAGTASIPTVFVEGLVCALSRYGTSKVLDKEQVLKDLPGVHSDSDRMTQWLNQLETEYDFVIYIADVVSESWAGTCFRQCDQLLLIADSRLDNPTDFHPNSIELGFATEAGRMRRSLAVVHPDKEKYTGTVRWLEMRTVDVSHHVALDRRNHFERLARFICGKATGLVASGGGAYAAAHIGVARALQEAGIGFDMIGGVSGGAAMAFSWPAEIDHRLMTEKVEKTMVASGALKKFTLPVYGIVDHRYFDKCLQEQYGGHKMEDFWVNFFTVSSNLSTGKLQIHRRGDTWRAIRASASIPGFLPPVVTGDGELLVDGGIIDNTPLSTMKQLKSGPNIVVCFESKHQNRTDAAYDELPGFFQTLLEFCRLRKASSGSSMPKIGSVLVQSMVLDNHSLDEVGEQDMVMRLSLPKDLRLNDWHRHREISDLGYQLAKEWLQRHDQNPVLESFRQIPMVCGQPEDKSVSMES